MPGRQTVYVRKSMNRYYLAQEWNKAYGKLEPMHRGRWKKIKKEQDFELPKQWKQWCADSKLLQSESNLRRYGGSSNRNNWLYLMGHGHVWRVNDKQMLQLGDTYEDFDRWALCAIDELPIPKTREEFRATVKALLKQRYEVDDVQQAQHEE